MTLARLALGFAAVAALFIGVAWATGRRGRGRAAAAAGEALALTLLAALWFASLGSGGWVPVFLLVGLLASGFGDRSGVGGGGRSWAPLIRVTVVAAMRYVAAGGLLALILR